jgi:glycyl-tRNA synthetase
VSNRKLFDELVKRRFIYGPAFDIYNGCGGLYDYGPVGTAIKNNIEQLWRSHFVLEDDMLEINGTCLTPKSVLEASVIKDGM